ncbi:MAG: TDP-N-acetylfucosamine:lipid II N-acetylfucosaminyltransferase [Bacteroidales bacterium]
MILHICDDNVFFKEIFLQFEIAAPGLSTYIINKPGYLNIKAYTNNKNVLLTENIIENIDNVLMNNKNIKIIIIHGLTNEKVKIVNRYYQKYKFLWVFWGADGLYLNRFKNKWFSQETRVLLKINKIITISLVSAIKNLFSNTILYQLFYYLCKGKYNSDYEKVLAIKRMNYIAPVIPDDYYLLRSKIKVNAQLVPFSIGSLNTLAPIKKMTVETGGNILLGNSADPSNNHIDVLKLLKKYKYDRKVFCPLSYGDTNYRSILVKEGIKLLSHNFIPLFKFLPLEKYHEIINSCDIVVMNHYRQQAMGTIISALYQGKKVFLNDKNYAKRYFERIGVKTYSVQKALVSTILNNDFKEINRIKVNNMKQLEKHYSHEAVIHKTKALIDIVLA